MASVVGQGTTFNLPNYAGELFNISPTETPFLSAIGGLTGGKGVNAKEWEWQTATIRNTAAGDTALEGANAPTANNQTRTSVSNVVEIHHKAIEVSYTKQAATQQLAGVNTDQTNPVTDELAFQTNLELSAIAIDIEKSFLSGTYAKPADNALPRKTRGILSAITTNVNAAADPETPRALSKAIVDETLATMSANGAPLTQDRTVLLMHPATKVKVSNLYGTAPLAAAVQSRTVGGVNITDLVTDFGTFGIMTDRWFPLGQIGIIDLSVCQPVFLRIPGKGFLFVEPLAKVGSSDKYQIYGECGLEYGPEVYHGLIKDLS